MKMAQWMALLFCMVGALIFVFPKRRLTVQDAPSSQRSTSGPPVEHQEKSKPVAFDIEKETLGFNALDRATFLEFAQGMQRADNPNLATSGGRALLDEAVEFNREDCVVELLRRGANPDGVNKAEPNHFRPIGLTLWSPTKIGMAKLLIAAGADLSNIYYDDKGWSALHELAFRNDNYELAKYMLDHGANVNGIYDDEKTPLMEAVEAKPPAPQMVRLLLAHGADVNAAPGNSILEVTALQLARDPEIAKLLLNAGAKLDITNERGQTAIHFAAMHEAAGVLKLLLAAGAPVDLEDKKHATPLIAFCDRRSTDNIEIPGILLAAGADINAKDADGRTPWNEAHDAHNRTLMKWLERHGARRE